MTLQSVNPASRQWGSLLSQPRYYPIKVDYKVCSCSVCVILLEGYHDFSFIIIVVLDIDGCRVTWNWILIDSMVSGT